MESLIFVGYFEYIFDAIKKYVNYNKVLIIEENFECNYDKVKTYFDVIIQVENIHDKEELNKEIEKILQKNKIKAIYATHEGVVEVCGYLREMNKIEGMNEYQSLSVRDKFIMKQLVIGSGIKTANIRRIVEESDVLDFISLNKYPVVIKPKDGSAAQDTFIIKNSNDLDKVINEVDIYDNKYIIESYVKGEEYHCDSIVVDGKVVFSSVGKYIANPIEIVCSDKPAASIIYPPQTDTDVIKEIKILNEKVISILNIENSICHLEVFETEKGEIIFGEIAARIGGGPLMGKSIKYSCNVDIYNAFVDVGVHNYELPKLESSNKFVGFVAFPTVKGKVMQIPKEEDYSHIVGLKEVSIFNKVGDFIGDNYNTSKRTGFIIIEDNDYDNLKNTLLQLHRDFKLVVSNVKLSIGNIYN